jgi:two-component system response regulator AtoC
VVELIVPPLHDHREDIPALAEEFARRYGERFGMAGVRLEPKLIEALQLADWPGNVRELENSVARMVALSGGGAIGPQAFTQTASGTAEPGAEPPPDGTLSLREQVEALERSVISRTLTSVAGNQSEAARRLGLSRGSLIDRLKKYGFAGSANDPPT